LPGFADLVIASADFTGLPCPYGACPREPVLGTRRFGRTPVSLIIGVAAYAILLAALVAVAAS
jgi:hypothetical protein